MRRLLFKSVTINLLSLGLLSFASYPANANAKEVKFQWNGSGCAKSESSTPWDPMVVQLVASKSVVSQFWVRKGSGASPKDVRKNCDLIVSSSEPLQFAVERIEVKGSGTLPIDAVVETVTETSSQGSPPSQKYLLERPKAEQKTFALNRSIDDKDLNWSACGRSLLVSTKQWIKAGVIVESKIEHLSFNLQAKACKK